MHFKSVVESAMCPDVASTTMSWGNIGLEWTLNCCYVILIFGYSFSECFSINLEMILIVYLAFLASRCFGEIYTARFLFSE